MSNPTGRAGKDSTPGAVVAAFFEEFEHVGHKGWECNGRTLPPAFVRAKSRWRNGARVSRSQLAHWLAYFNFTKATFDNRT